MTFDEILALIDRIDESSLSEVRVSDGDQTVLLRRGGDQPAQMLPGAIPAAMGAQFPNPNMQIPVSSGGNGAAAAAAPGTADGTGHTGGTSGEAAAAADEAAGDSGLEQITSPIVGTFYRSPAPDSPPYVEEGTEIKEGETLCIIEAMKVMNELEAEFDLRVERVLVENGAMVEYGSPILEVRRL